MKYTVIIVNYNKEKYLHRCLDSIVNQTYKDFEIIIVDDGSTDKSREIINSYKKKYKNIRTFFKENTGVADTRNFAVTKVKTKYFTFVDSDDYIAEDLLEKIDKYEDYDILSFEAYMVVNQKIKDIPPKSRYPKTPREKYHNKVIVEPVPKNGIEILEILTRNRCLFLVPWGFIYNTAFFRKNKIKYEEGYVHEDVSTTTIAILKAKKIICTNIFGYYYDQTLDSITRTSDAKGRKKSMIGNIHNYKIVRKILPKEIKDKKTYEQILNYYNEIVIGEGKKMKGKTRKEYINLLKENKIHENIVRRGIPNNVKYFFCSKSYNLYYRTYKLSVFYYAVRKVYYLVIKHERI